MNRLVIVFFLSLTSCIPVHAETEPDSDTRGWTGIVGVGPIVFPRYTGGKSSQTWLIPVISVEYNNVLYIEPLRAGVYFWGSQDRKMGFGLALEPRMGFKAGDASQLAGMNTRNNSIEGGPAFDWDLGYFSISVSLFTDLTNSSHGESARLYAYREIVKNATWKLGAYGGIDWMSNRVSNYFFGVTEGEATLTRPAFHAGSATNVVAGLDAHYRLNRESSLLFGLQLTKLNHEVAYSPIVESAHAIVGWIGIGWNL